MKNRFRRVLGSLLGSGTSEGAAASVDEDAPAPHDPLASSADEGRPEDATAQDATGGDQVAAGAGETESGSPVDSPSLASERAGEEEAHAAAPQDSGGLAGVGPEPSPENGEATRASLAGSTGTAEPARRGPFGRRSRRKDRAERRKQEAERLSEPPDRVEVSAPREANAAVNADEGSTPAAALPSETAAAPDPVTNAVSAAAPATSSGSGRSEPDENPLGATGSREEASDGTASAAAAVVAGTSEPSLEPSVPQEDASAPAAPEGLASEGATTPPAVSRPDEAEDKATAIEAEPSADPRPVDPREGPSTEPPSSRVPPPDDEVEEVGTRLEATESPGSVATLPEPVAPVEPSEIHEDFDVPDRPRHSIEDAVRSFRDSPVMFFEQDADLRYVVVHNPPVLTEDLVLGKTDGDIFEPRDARRIVEIKRAVLEMGHSTREEIEVRLGGHGSSFELLVEPRRGPDGEVQGIVGILLEIDGRKRAEAALIGDHDRLERRIVELEDELEIVRGALGEEDLRRRRAEEAAQSLQDQDSLTGLPTRRVFNDRLAMSIVHSRRQRTKFALVLLGLDGFRGINESLGRSVGDDLLRSVATVLEQCLRQGDTVSRLGGDEFVLLLPGFHRDDDVVGIAEKLRVSLRTPFTIGGRHVSITGSLGIAVFPEDGTDAESLLQNAAVALRRAKVKGGDAFDVHAPVTSARAAERLGLENALRRALVGDALALHYQPIVEAATGRILGVEALLRFRNPSGRLVPVSESLRELDATSLAVPLGLWSLRTACSQVRAWRDRHLAHLTVAVNLTGRQLLHPSLVALVQRALGETGLPPEGLELEVAEKDLVKSAEPALARLAELKQLGVRVAVDEFGTGEALISRLQRFPVDSIKIDRSVIRGIENDEAQKGVAAAAIALARARRLAVVAEGVETEGQRALLIRWRCDRLQGSLCGAPLPAQELESELESATRA